MTTNEILNDNLGNEMQDNKEYIQNFDILGLEIVNIIKNINYDGMQKMKEVNRIIDDCIIYRKNLQETNDNLINIRKLNYLRHMLFRSKNIQNLKSITYENNMFRINYNNIYN
jgi:hypothetical protein